MSVTPSAALTRNRSGGVQPVAGSLAMSARSSWTSTRPDQSRTRVTGGVATVDGELGDVGALELDQHPPGPVANRRRWRGVHSGRGVDEVLHGVRHGDDVVQLVVGDPGEAGAVQTDPAHRAPVRILFDQPGSGE